MYRVKLILIVVIFGSFAAANAQKRMEIGVKAGVQSAKFWNGSFADITTKRYNRVRPAFGGFGKLHLSKVFFAEYGLDASWEGGGFKKRRTNLTFIKNSIFLGVSTSTKRKNSFYLKFGINHSLLLSAKIDDRYLDEKESVREYFEVSTINFPFAIGYVRKLNNGLSMGVGGQFQILSGPLSSQDHIDFAQTFRRAEIFISKEIEIRQKHKKKK